MTTQKDGASGVAAHPAATAVDGKRKASGATSRRRRKRPSTSMAAVLQAMRQQLAPLHTSQDGLRAQVAALSARRDELARQLADIAGRHATMVARNADMAATNAQLKQQALAACTSEEQWQQLMRSLPPRPAHLAGTATDWSSMVGVGVDSSSFLHAVGPAMAACPPPFTLGQGNGPAAGPHTNASSSTYSQPWALQGGSGNMGGPLAVGGVQLGAPARDEAAAAAAAGVLGGGACAPLMGRPCTMQELTLPSHGCSPGLGQPTGVEGPQQLQDLAHSGCPAQLQGHRGVSEQGAPEQQQQQQQQQQQVKEEQQQQQQGCLFATAAAQAAGGWQPQQPGPGVAESGQQLDTSPGTDSSPRGITPPAAVPPHLPTKRSSSSSLTMEQQLGFLSEVHGSPLNGNRQGSSRAYGMAGPVSPAASDSMTDTAALLNTGCSPLSRTPTCRASSSCSSLSQLANLQVEFQQQQQQQQQLELEIELELELQQQQQPMVRDQDACQGDGGACLPAATMGFRPTPAAAGCLSGRAAEAAASAATGMAAALHVVPGDRYTALVRPPLQPPSTAFAGAGVPGPAAGFLGNPEAGSMSSFLHSAAASGSLSRRYGALSSSSGRGTPQQCHWERLPTDCYTTGQPRFPAPAMQHARWGLQAGIGAPGQHIAPAPAAHRAAAAAGGLGGFRLAHSPPQQQQQKARQQQQQEASRSMHQVPGVHPTAPSSARGGLHAEPLGVYPVHGTPPAAAAAGPCVGSKRPATNSSLAASSKRLCNPSLGEGSAGNGRAQCLPSWGAPAGLPASCVAGEGLAYQHQHQRQQRTGDHYPPMLAAAAGAGAWQGDVYVDVGVTRGTYTGDRVTTPATPSPAVHRGSGGAPMQAGAGDGLLCAAEADTGDLLQFIDDMMGVNMEEFASLCSSADVGW